MVEDTPYPVPVNCSVINFIQLIVYTLYYMRSESVEMNIQIWAAAERLM